MQLLYNLTFCAIRFYLKGLQEGWDDSVTHEGTVGGKL
jgi:hypothetical protein